MFAGEVLDCDGVARPDVVHLRARTTARPAVLAGREADAQPLLVLASPVTPFVALAGIHAVEAPDLGQPAEPRAAQIHPNALEGGAAAGKADENERRRPGLPDGTFDQGGQAGGGAGRAEL